MELPSSADAGGLWTGLSRALPWQMGDPLAGVHVSRFGQWHVTCCSCTACCDARRGLQLAAPLAPGFHQAVSCQQLLI